ncbi:MAG TPA: DinB family protein [Niabella sp.]
MYIFNIINSIREKVTTIIRSTSIEELNRIPEGFNNTIAWNFGHLVVSGYSLVFRATQADPDFQIPYLDQFKKGTKPEAPVTAAAISELIALADTFTRAVQDALNTDRFTTVSEYTTGTFGVPVTSIEEMIATVALHDAVHWQIIRDYKRIFDTEK